jgi:carboxyl-terminal processing protease
MPRMRRHFLICTCLSLFLAACGDSGSASRAPQVGTSACSIDGQKQFVLDRMRDVYYWYDMLPATVDLAAYPTPEALLDYLVSFQPLDDFSYIDLAASDARFFAEGQYEGFGFSTRFEAQDELRFTRVFNSSPANVAGFARGQRILRLNGRTVADIEASEGIGALFSLPSLEFTVGRLDGSEFTTTVDQDIVTIDPVPQHRVISRPDGTMVGYVELVTFISTAESELVNVFGDFLQAGVTDVIIDLRYNSGGLVITAELLGDLLGGGVADGTTFSRTLFNDRNSAANRIEYFERQVESVSLSRLAIIATNQTASASELVTNSMFPHADVTIVGAATRGKPVGQLGIPFCEKILRPTSFETVNSLGEGQYFDGLAADCAAADDLSIAIGDDTDPNMVAAMSVFDTGGCPAQMSAPSGLQKPAAVRDVGRAGPAWRQAGAW